MADRVGCLQRTVDTIGRLGKDGFTGEWIQEMFTAALTHLGGPGEVPYARCTCINCGAVHVAWSEYPWALMVQTPCRSFGKPW